MTRPAMGPTHGPEPRKDHGPELLSTQMLTAIMVMMSMIMALIIGNQSRGEGHDDDDHNHDQ